MRKLGLGILIGVVVLGLSGIVTAGRLISLSDQVKENAKADISPVIEKTDEGFALSPPGLEKIVFIHYREGFAKPPGVGRVKGAACYGFLSKGAKLKSIEDLTINPALGTSAILAAANEWSSYTSTTLFGAFQTDSTADWDNEVPDGRNEFSYGNYPQEGVIAVTVVWGYFSGPPSTREIVEFDVLFDNDFVWGDVDVSPAVMDLQNIATHELGHGVGLADVYQTACSEVTMYGYSEYGETQKRTLETPDVTGLQKLYGI